MTERITRVAVLGAGAMGGMYAAHFARAGFDVRLVARGDRARRLRVRGLTVNGERFALPVIDADAPPPDWTADLALFAVKDRHLEAAIESARPVVGPGTAVLSVLNGLDSEERIADALGAGTPGGPTVLLCIALAMDAERIGDEVRYRQAGRLVLGAAEPGEPGPVVLRVGEALGRAGLEHALPTDMRHRLWWKFMVNAGINQASAVLNAPYGAFQEPGDARELMSDLIAEVVAVANAEGVALGADDVAAWHEVLAGQPPEGRTSMHQDVLAGRPTEVDTFGGRVVALGERHGIPTPVNRTVARILRATSRSLPTS